MPTDKNNLILEIVNHLDAMVAYWDINQTCVFANSAFRTWFGKDGKEFIGIALKDLLGPVLYEKNLPFIKAAYAGEKQVFEREIPRPEGGFRHSLITYVPRIVDGQVDGMFVHVADVSLLKKLEEELKIARDKAEELAT